MKASGASVKLFEYIDRIPKIVNNGIEKPNHFQGRIEFKNVSFAFPNRKNDQVLKNISFTVQPGQQVALVGPSGSKNLFKYRKISKAFDCY
jgi:ATP-binding cassette subfamily B (MDR/TAP) protein 9